VNKVSYNTKIYDVNFSSSGLFHDWIINIWLRCLTLLFTVQWRESLMNNGLLSLTGKIISADSSTFVLDTRYRCYLFLCLWSGHCLVSSVIVQIVLFRFMLLFLILILVTWHSYKRAAQCLLKLVSKCGLKYAYSFISKCWRITVNLLQFLWSLWSEQ
jgi:hypothetical protein